VPRTTPPTIVAEAPALPSAAPRMPVTSSFSEASSAAAPAPRIITRAAGFAAASALGGDAPRAATTQTAGFDVPAVPAPATPHRAAGARDAGFGSAPAAVPGAQTRATPMRNAGFAAEPVAAAASTRARRVASAGGFESQAAAPVLIASREPSAAAGFAAAVAAAPKAAPPPAAAPLSRALEILEKPRPAYTEEARRLQVEGEVVLEAEFPAAGPVRVLRVIRGLGHGLDEAALQAARAIRFRPAERNGVPSATTAQVRIAFQLAF
jgi:TonB family protein